MIKSVVFNVSSIYSKRTSEGLKGNIYFLVLPWCTVLASCTVMFGMCPPHSFRTLPRIDGLVLCVHVTHVESVVKLEIKK